MPQKKSTKSSKTTLSQGEKAARQRSIIIALDWYDERIVRGIYNYAREQNWHISPYLAAGRFVPHGWPSDGAITCYGSETSSYIDFLNMPVVDISYLDMPRQVPRVRVDNDAISKLAAEHFIARGYKFFAYYAWHDVPVNALRHDRFKQHLLANGIPEENIFAIKQSEGSLLGDWESHKTDIIDQVNQLPRPLAVFAGQDNLGASLIEMCVRESIHVPEEIAVLGVDNTELICEGSPVPLSSVRTRLTDLGYKAAEQLDRLMNKEINTKAEPLLVPPHGIVSRQSTDVLAIEHPAVATAVRYIKQHYGEPITIEDIIEFIGLSKRGLEKAFEKHLGRTPASELRRIRLDEAKRLLTETNDKIDSIALDCGYSNSSNLSCAFRRDTKLSPRAYRMKFSKAETHPDY
ncbi:MAG: substrate-binding domain-containing protein [Puniceicoccaceae bacterium]|nr:substrate-binding domain-containing protein [Puniceicoccaceae bacterium]